MGRFRVASGPECSGHHTISHVAGIERPTVSGEGVDHLVVVDDGDGGLWADREARRVLDKTLDRHRVDSGWFA